MTQVAVVAPAAFGEAGAAYLDGAAGALGNARCALVDGPGSLERALGPLGGGDVVLGSLGSELAAEVARVAAARGLVHVEAGALGDEALGPSSFRLTPARAEIARAAALLAVGNRAGVVTERSPFGAAMRAALTDALAAEGVDVAASTDAEDVLGDPGGWTERNGIDVAVAALRGDLAERLVTALAGHAPRVRVVGAAGAWTRAEVGRAARGAAAPLVLCEVMAPTARPAPVDGGGHGLYEDLGRAAGAVLALALAGGRAARDALVGLDLDDHASPLGYGVRFDAEGRNERARPALLQWKDGVMTSYEPGGPA